MRNNKKRLGRRWDAGESDFVYTNLGKQYLGLRKEVEEYVAMLPIRIQGKNKKTGKAYERIGHLPHQALNVRPLTVPMALSRVEKEKRIKDQILAQVDTSSLIEVSDEKYLLQENAEWRLHVLTTKVVGEDGEIATSAILNRPLAQEKPLQYSHLLSPWAISKEAFEIEGNCVIHQLSKQFDICKESLKETMNEICYSLYKKTLKDLDGRCTAQMVLKYCEKTSRGCHILWGFFLIHTATTEKRRHRGSFAAAIWGDHLYAYSDSNTKHSIALTNPRKLSGQKLEILGKPGGESQVQLHEYSPFDKMEPGKFWTNSDEMENIKNDLLRQGIVPKIRTENFLEIRQIQVHGEEETTILFFSYRLRFIKKPVRENRF